MNKTVNVKLIECPRDAMQGWTTMIPTQTKIDYLNQLLQVGFDTIDFGSFVSVKAIPQLADTKEVLKGLKMQDAKSKLLAIIANTRGAEEAVQFDEITYLGFPFSISETFQKLNTNKTIEESLKTIEEIQNNCVKHDKKLVTYISMGFGNPYGDEYNSEIAIGWVEKLSSLGLSIFSMSDTVGVSNPDNIRTIFSHLVEAFPQIEFGAHFHSTQELAEEKIEAAFANHCYRFDHAVLGIGGCPMAQNDLVGNLSTEAILSYFDKKEISLNLDREALFVAQQMAAKIFH